MATHEQIAARFAQEAGKPHPKLLRATSGSLFVNPHNDRQLLSSGTHFVLAEIMYGDDGNRSWWLVNGDQYSVSTTRHQAITRRALAGSGLPMLIVPFTVLDRADIPRSTIRPVDITQDGTERIRHTAPTLAEVPEQYRSRGEDSRGEYGYRRTADGKFEWSTWRHWLGASVFTAAYTYWPSRDATERRAASASFLSAFDDQEYRPLYFLAQLPDGSMPATVSEAFRALKPAEVTAAESAGLQVTRQGDVFAIPAGITTRQLPCQPATRQHGAYVLGVNHTATESCTAGDVTYARGTLRHVPRQTWRQPEHRRQRMGDGKTWHVLVRNTVPDGRSWSAGGRVD